MSRIYFLKWVHSFETNWNMEILHKSKEPGNFLLLKEWYSKVRIFLIENRKFILALWEPIVCGGGGVCCKCWEFALIKKVWGSKQLNLNDGQSQQILWSPLQYQKFTKHCISPFIINYVHAPENARALPQHANALPELRPVVRWRLTADCSPRYRKWLPRFCWRFRRWWPSSCGSLPTPP